MLLSTLSIPKVARFTYGPQDMAHGRYFQRLHLGSVGHRVISTRLLYPKFVIGPTCEGENTKWFLFAWFGKQSSNCNELSQFTGD